MFANLDMWAQVIWLKVWRYDPTSTTLLNVTAHGEDRIQLVGFYKQDSFDLLYLFPFDYGTDERPQMQKAKYKKRGRDADTSHIQSFHSSFHVFQVFQVSQFVIHH